MMQVVQDDDEWHVPSTIFTGTLVSKVGQVLAQLLKAQEEHRVTVQPQRGSTWSLHGIQAHGGWEAHGGLSAGKPACTGGIRVGIRQRPLASGTNSRMCICRDRQLWSTSPLGLFVCFDFGAHPVMLKVIHGSVFRN